MFGKWHTNGSVDFRPVAAYIRKVRTASGAIVVKARTAMRRKSERACFHNSDALRENNDYAASA